MYSKKVILAVSAAGILTLGVTGSAMAFHDGGVAKCSGCHSMHQTPDGALGSAYVASVPVLDASGNPTFEADGVTPIMIDASGTKGAVGNAVANGWLTKGSDASSTCLNCHYGATGKGVVSSDGSGTSAGGDFYWLTKTYDGSHQHSVGDNHGHNIVAADFGLVADGINATAPGSGDAGYLAANMGCTSCHDAHGQVNGGTKHGAAGLSLPISGSGSKGGTPAAGTQFGNYRLLGDGSYTAGNTVDDDFVFTKGAPTAVAANGGSGNKSYGAKVAYGSGMSEWCANCHTDLQVAGHDGMHPAGNSTKVGIFASNYDKYVRTGNFTGTNATAYDSLVPFERGAAATLDTTDTTGPGATGNVMCLTCHRAHASAFDNAGRWDFGQTLLADSGALTDTTVPTTAAPYYKDGVKIDVTAETQYGAEQRSLCNKCHVQD